ncbi:MAG: hypothetical protein K8R58_14215 [Bacteroidales bacterium]|nr:hypothetical protein [Bacteroidales bacterium]
MDIKNIFTWIKWRLKAIKRAKENNTLRKRIKELKGSRDNFRSKYYDLKNKYEELETTNKEIENELKKN